MKRCDRRVTRHNEGSLLYRMADSSDTASEKGGGWKVVGDVCVIQSYIFRVIETLLRLS